MLRRSFPSCAFPHLHRTCGRIWTGRLVVSWSKERSACHRRRAGRIRTSQFCLAAILPRRPICARECVYKYRAHHSHSCDCSFLDVYPRICNHIIRKAIRIYSITTLLTVLICGALTGPQAANLAIGQPTPWLGLTERTNIYSFMLWVVMLAITLFRAREDSEVPSSFFRCLCFTVRRKI